MKTILLPNEQVKKTKPVQLTFFQRWMKGLVVGKLSLLKHGKLQLLDEEGTLTFGSKDTGQPLSVTITVYDPGFLYRPGSWAAVSVWRKRTCAGTWCVMT